MPKHMAMVATIIIRSPTTMEVVDGRDRDRDRDRDNKVVVAHLAVVLGAEANSVFMVAIVCPTGSPQEKVSFLFTSKITFVIQGHP